MKVLYNSQNCPCPHDCVRRSSCGDCIRFHHAKGGKTYCEKLADGEVGQTAPRAESGKQIRLLDYGACAG